MRKTILTLLLMLSAATLSAQIVPKMNALYLPFGIFNPAVEFPLSPRYTYQAEIVYSPWLGFHENGMHKPLHFGIFLNEVRRYFGERNKGWYAAANAGAMGFNLSKPYLSGGKLRFYDGTAKGFGLMLGICGGYEYRINDKWLIDCYFGWSFTASWYNGYFADGSINMTPHGHENDNPPDPFNGSNEYYPNKIGVSVGYRF
ncbi:MAG: DUF3575 domain-containing protein [Prevotellaceae bacterium]|nr:DUF3575 domain-containing protein [Prevotellaceae bacterium]